MKRRKLYEKLNIVVSRFLDINMSYLGTIPMDNNNIKAVMKQKPVSLIYPSSASSRHFIEVAEKIMNEETDIPPQKRGIRGYLKSVLLKLTINEVNACLNRLLLEEKLKRIKRIRV